MNLITINLLISMIGILAIGAISTNIVFGQTSPYPKGSGGGCGTGGCSSNYENDGSDRTGGGGGGGIFDGNPSGIYAGGGGFGGESYPKFASPCGAGGGGAYDSNTGERIGSGIGGGISCDPGQ